MVADGQVLAETTARQAALDLLAAAEAVVDADRYRSPGREIEALADAALMFAIGATAARWVRVGGASVRGVGMVGPARRHLVLVRGEVRP